jgi:glycosyltransferase involved in cell wall biosynthesis
MSSFAAYSNFTVKLKLHRAHKAPPRPEACIQFYGLFGQCDSIANVCGQYARQFAAGRHPVALYGINGPDFFDTTLATNYGINTAAPVGMFYGIPDDVDDYLDDHQFKIGGFVCETDRIHPDWVDVCNRLDRVVVPSSFCKQAFESSGVSVPVEVVNHGLEPAYRPYGDKQLGDRFVFYNTFYASSFPERKSCEELIRSFSRAFQHRDDVVLRLRTDPTPALYEFIRKYRADKLIWIDNIRPLSTEDYARIYSEVHCTVHPSKGEGFGLIPFQSIACGTPVIAPVATGMADYLTPDNAIPLRTKGRVAGVDLGNKVGTYHGIDEDHLVDLLRYTMDNWQAENDKVRRCAADFRDRYSWHNVLSPFVSRLESLLARCG